MIVRDIPGGLYHVRLSTLILIAVSLPQIPRAAQVFFNAMSRFAALLPRWTPEPEEFPSNEGLARNSGGNGGGESGLSAPLLQTSVSFSSASNPIIKLPPKVKFESADFSSDDDDDLLLASSDTDEDVPLGQRATSLKRKRDEAAAGPSTVSTDKPPSAPSSSTSSTSLKNNIAPKVRRDAKYNVLCQVVDCPRCASFNFPGLLRRFCAAHKKDGMVNVAWTPRNKTGEGEGEGAGRGDRRQRQHQRSAFDPSSDSDSDSDSDYNPEPQLDPPTTTTKRISPFLRKDAKSNLLCQVIDCPRYASFNWPLLKRRFCSDHKEDGMVNHAWKPKEKSGHPTNGSSSRAADIEIEMEIDGTSLPALRKKPKQQCHHKNCSTQASFNYAGMDRAYCSKHRKQGMVDVTRPGVGAVKKKVADVGRNGTRRCCSCWLKRHCRGLDGLCFGRRGRGLYYVNHDHSANTTGIPTSSLARPTMPTPGLPHKRQLQFPRVETKVLCPS